MLVFKSSQQQQQRCDARNLRALVECESYSNNIDTILRYTSFALPPRRFSALFVTCATFCEFFTVFAVVVHFREHLPGGHAPRELRWSALDVVCRDTCRAELPAVGHAFVRRTAHNLIGRFARDAYFCLFEISHCYTRKNGFNNMILSGARAISFIDLLWVRLAGTSSFKA
ncbi:hypothetical protein AGLY_007058 [Aphis glycines]|uniref:Uncharacterized protein n=1 Tax=Aphis glycines TaxID=307491 RepID=A0A6G0TPZ8_APHGL|nr:hypothetical protein AGLY_007058 [Aphis glycines]